MSHIFLHRAGVVFAPREANVCVCVCGVYAFTVVRTGAVVYMSVAMHACTVPCTGDVVHA